MSLITIVQNLAQLVSGPFGISFIILAVGATFLAAAAHFIPPRSGFVALACGAMAYTAAWAVNTYLGA